MAAETVLSVRHLSKRFPVRSLLGTRGDEDVVAVDDVTFDVHAGETLGIVGESGSGKSTLAMCILQITRPTSGEVLFRGSDLVKMRGADLRRMRREVQIVFQDPYSSLNPRMTVGRSVREPLDVHGVGTNEDRVAKVAELLTQVGFDPEVASRYPHEFSGGQRQRICIARALVLDPQIVVCDECVSALDVSVQAQVLNLLKDLQQERGLTYVFISHDLAVVQHMSDRIAVMSRGKVVELGTTDDVCLRPTDPYTQALLSAARNVDLDEEDPAGL